MTRIVGSELSDEELAQRRGAAKKHGVYAIRDRGEEAMTPEQRTRRAELAEQLQTRPGVIEAMRDQAVETLLLAEVAQSFVIEQHRRGDNLDEIKLLKSLPAFWNSAGRALKNYLDVLPSDEDVLDLAEHVIRAMGEDGADDS